MSGNRSFICPWATLSAFAGTSAFWIAGLGFASNALLNWLLIYGLGWGIAGSAAGTVLAQWGMVGAYVVVIGRLARRHEASVRPQRDGVSGSALASTHIGMVSGSPNRERKSSRSTGDRGSSDQCTCQTREEAKKDQRQTSLF